MYPLRAAGFGGFFKCVHNLMEIFGADVSAVSRRLSVLKNARIITDDTRGAGFFFSSAVSCIIIFAVSRINSCIRARADHGLFFRRSRISVKSRSCSEGFGGSASFSF
ncbi:MAG: helix-turn-helix transcriptional regulator [Deltaproteobacteria bacterium]|nr:helix-turn-helix transcriptional regulator [Candidatus Zymogenaceae bacterium]